MGDISVNKQVSFLAGNPLEPLDPQTAQFFLVMDVDSSCFNETDKQLPPRRRRHSEEKLLYRGAKELMPDLHLFSLFKMSPDLLHFFIGATRYLYNRMESLKPLLNPSVTIITWFGSEQNDKRLKYTMEPPVDQRAALRWRKGDVQAVGFSFAFYLAKCRSTLISEYSYLKKTGINSSIWSQQLTKCENYIKQKYIELLVVDLIHINVKKINALWPCSHLTWVFTGQYILIHSDGRKCSFPSLISWGPEQFVLEKLQQIVSSLLTGANIICYTLTPVSIFALKKSVFKTENCSQAETGSITERK